MRAEFTTRQIESALLSVAGGVSIRAAAKASGVSISTVRRHAIASAVPIRAPLPKAVIRHDAFDVIGDEETAYWLGFIAADGCVHDTGHLSFNLSSKDATHLNRFASFIGTGVHVHEYEYRFPIAALEIRSLPITASLCALGVGPRKSLTLPWFEVGELTPHFLRGYFDGDGCVCTVYRGQRSTRIGVSIVSSLRFAKGCADYLIRNGICAHVNKTGSKAFTVRVGAQMDILRFARLIYSEATVCLERKHAIFLRLLRDGYTDRRRVS